MVEVYSTSPTMKTEFHFRAVAGISILHLVILSPTLAADSASIRSGCKRSRDKDRLSPFKYCFLAGIFGVLIWRLLQFVTRLLCMSKVLAVMSVRPLWASPCPLSTRKVLMLDYMSHFLHWLDCLRSVRMVLQGARSHVIIRKSLCNTAVGS